MGEIPTAGKEVTGDMYKKWAGGVKPAMRNGWLFKKSGGKESNGGYLSPGRSNWNRRWFHLENGILNYYDEKVPTKDIGTTKVKEQLSSKFRYIIKHVINCFLFQALFTGDLREAKTDEQGLLIANVKLNEKRERFLHKTHPPFHYTHLY